MSFIIVTKIHTEPEDLQFTLDEKICNFNVVVLDVTTFCCVHFFFTVVALTHEIGVGLGKEEV